MNRNVIYVFDWDNTLVDTRDKGINCLHKAINEFGIQKELAYFYDNYSPDYYLLYKDLKIESKYWQDINDLWLKHYANATGTVLFPDAKTVLDKLILNNCILGLVTTGQRVRIYSELESLHLKNKFKYILCREDVKKVKPDPEALIKIKSQLNNNMNIIYVGDHEEDIQMAKNASINSFKITRDIQNDADSHCIHDLQELLTFFK